MAIKPVPGYKLQEIGSWAVPKAKKTTVPPLVPGGPGGAGSWNGIVLRAPDANDPVQSIVAPTLANVGGGGGGGGGGTSGGGITVPFDYESAIRSDYLYPGVESAFNTATAAGRAALREMIRNAVIQSGYNISSTIPSDLSEYAGDIDPATAAAAAANPLSGRAQLQDALTRGQSDLNYDLAARGIGRSGALEAGNTDLLRQYDVQSNTQQQDLLSAIRNGVGQYRSSLADASTQRQNALAAIATRLAQMQGGTYDDGSYSAGSSGGGGGGGVLPGILGGALTPGENYIPNFSGLTPPSNNTVNWGGQSFTTKAALTRYLKSRGENPALWAQQHASAWGRLG
jgi:hypothetical protein